MLKGARKARIKNAKVFLLHKKILNQTMFYDPKCMSIILVYFISYNKCKSMLINSPEYFQKLFLSYTLTNSWNKVPLVLLYKLCFCKQFYNMILISQLVSICDISWGLFYHNLDAIIPSILLEIQWCCPSGQIIWIVFG